MKLTENFSSQISRKISILKKNHSYLGVCIDSGARYEVGYPSGVSHFLEKIAFSSTSKFDYKDDILQKLEMYGGICDCQSTRDTFLYAASVENRGLEATIEILGMYISRKFHESIRANVFT